MEKTYKVNVFNTLTGKYETVPVSEEVYHAYTRTDWNIKDNDKSFYKHEIQFSILGKAENDSFENFHEFIDTSNNPEKLLIKRAEDQTLHTALSKLTNDEFELIQALLFNGQTESSYAKSVGVKQQTIHKKKERILKKIKKFLSEGC